MTKKKVKPLTLSRETIRILEDELSLVQGAASSACNTSNTQYCSDNNNCTWSKCHD